MRIPTGIFEGTRWTVLGPASPGHRRGGSRARLKCRCSCGDERLVFVEDLTAGRSRGCPSARCRADFNAATLSQRTLEAKVMPHLDPLMDGIREAMKTAALDYIHTHVRDGATPNEDATRGPRGAT